MDAFRPRYRQVPRVGGGDHQPVVVPVLRHDPMALSEIADYRVWADIGWNLVAVPVTARGRLRGVLAPIFATAIRRLR